METIIRYSIEKIDSNNFGFKRYLYDEILNSGEKIVGIVGMRGVGKTTLLLQIAKNFSDKSLYFSCDSVFVIGKSIFEIVENGYKNYSYKYFFIDEIHKYKNWQQDLKTIYDFFPDVKIYFSGSSSIDLIKGNYDLSRRGILFHLHKFSFREYLNLKYGFDLKIIGIQEILTNYKKLSLDIYSRERNISKYFKDYLNIGEFGFSFNTEEKYYNDRLGNIINKMIYEDVSSFYSLKTENIYYFFEILKFISNSSPSNVNYSNIAKLLQTTPDTIKFYIQILSEIGFLNIFGVEGKISLNLRKTKKILFESINFLEYFSDNINLENTIGTKRESFVVSMLKKDGQVFYPERGDVLFVLKDFKYLFEVGSKNKKKSQIKNIENAFLIKDDLDIGVENEIPIWLFGMLY